MFGKCRALSWVVRAIPKGRGGALAGLGLMLLLALALLALSSMPSSATLLESETAPRPPQYYDFNTAFNLSVGTPAANVTFLRDSGGDDDYFRLQGLVVGDLVKLWVNQTVWEASVEYYLSDPGRYPIYYYDTGGEEDRERFNFSFLVALDGDYFLHTGQGFGLTLVSVNCTVVHGAGVPDGNDGPANAVRLGSGEEVSTDLDRIYDPSDFYVINLTTNASVKTFLMVTILEVTGGNHQWELYNTTGVLRTSEDYLADTLYLDTGSMPFYELSSRGDLFLRLWCTYWRGTVRFSLDVVEYPRDGDGIASALEVRDGDVVVESLDTLFDKVDYFSIALGQGDALNLWLEVEEDLDLFLRDGGGATRARSDGYGNVTEHLEFRMTEAGPEWYYIDVHPYNIDPVEPRKRLNYTLTVRTNLDPVADPFAAGLDAVHIVQEDVPDESIDLARLFTDPEGGPLTYIILPGHDQDRINASLNGTRLRLATAPNDSGFHDTVVVKAIDDHGYWCVCAVHVYVKGVDDPPVVALIPAPVAMDEDGTSAAVNLAPFFTDVDDPFWNLTITVACPPQMRVSLTEGVATFTAAEPNWNGEAYCIVRATDTGGLYAEMELVVVVRPVNDAPVIRRSAYSIDTVHVLLQIDVVGFFSDVDGDVLSYNNDAPALLNISMKGSVLWIPPSEDIYYIAFNLTAIDPSGLMSGPIPIIVSYMLPDGPLCTLSPLEYTVEEGTAIYITNFTFHLVSAPQNFVVTLSAEGGSWGFLLRLLDNGISWPNGQPTWTPKKLRETRDVPLIVHLETDEGISEDIPLTVHVLRYNRAPVVQRVGPDSTKAYHQGDEIIVFADAVDPDGDPLVFKWYLDDRLVDVSGNTLHINFATEGVHHVRVTASDGELNMTNNGSFAVLGSETTEGAWGTWVIAAVAVVIVGTFSLALCIRRRRRAPKRRSGGAS